MKIPRPSLWPFLIWLIICTIMLCLPGSAFPKAGWLDSIFFDKWVHIGIFSTLTFLYCWGLTGKGIKTKRLQTYFILIGLACFAYGVGMEYVQDNFIPNRSFDNGDIIADGIGAILGVIVSSIWFIKK